MNLACIHTHTNFCDGEDDVETFCRMAQKKKLSSLGFSAHAPVTLKTGFITDWHLKDARLNEYLDCIRDAKKRWEGKLDIYLGFEVDFIEGIIGPSGSDYREMGLDYIIASIHYVVPPRGKPFTVDDSPEVVDRGIKEGFGGDPMGMVEKYFDAEEAMIKAGGFDILGHPDLLKKNNQNSRLFSEDGEYYRERCSIVAGLAAESGLTAEVNTGGINRGKIKDCYPSPAFLKQFRVNNVPMVINADAHRAEDIDGHYEEARNAMLAAGYTETVLFAGRSGGKAVWKSEKLAEISI